MPNMTKAKRVPAAKTQKSKGDFVTQAEIKAVAELENIARDLAIEVRRRIENGARVQKGRYAAHVERGASPIPDERRHREGCAAASLGGLYIVYSEVDHPRTKARHA